MFPKCCLPELCIPVSILAMICQLKTEAKSMRKVPMHQALHLDYVKDLLAFKDSVERMVFRSRVHLILAVVSAFLLLCSSRAAF